MGLGIDAMSWCANFVAKLPGAVGRQQAIPQQAFVLMVLGGLWLTLWQSRINFSALGLCAGIMAIRAGPVC
jgi:competence protein ComEC